MMKKGQKKDSEERYRILESGAVQDLTTGKIVSNSGVGKYAITRANSAAMLSKRRQKYLRSHMRGLAMALYSLTGSEPDEDIFEKATNTLEVCVAHMARTFVNSDNLRGMGEVFSKLVVPVLAQEQAEEQEEKILRRGDLAQLLHELAALARKAEQQDDSQVIDVEPE